MTQPAPEPGDPGWEPVPFYVQRKNGTVEGPFPTRYIGMDGTLPAFTPEDLTFAMRQGDRVVEADDVMYARGSLVFGLTTLYLTNLTNVPASILADLAALGR